MTKKIVAIGGGENGRITSDGTRKPYETGPIDQEIIHLTGKENPHFFFWRTLKIQLKMKIAISKLCKQSTMVDLVASANTY